MASWRPLYALLTMLAQFASAEKEQIGLDALVHKLVEQIEAQQVLIAELAKKSDQQHDEIQELRRRSTIMEEQMSNAAAWTSTDAESSVVAHKQKGPKVSPPLENDRRLTEVNPPIPVTKLRLGTVLFSAANESVSIEAASGVHVSGVLQGAATSSVNASAQAVYRVADPAETLWWQGGTARTTRASSDHHYYVRLGSFPFARTTRMAFTYRSWANSEQGGLVDCIVPTYAAFNENAYGSIAGGNTIYCEVTNHGLHGQQQTLLELVYVRASATTTSRREIWLHVFDAYNSHSDGTRIAIKCMSYSEVCPETVDYNAAVTGSSATAFPTADTGSGHIFDRLTIKEGGRSVGPAV